MKKTIKEKIKGFLRDIFAPRIEKHYYNMPKGKEEQFDKVFKKMDETFKEMDQFFNI